MAINEEAGTSNSKCYSNWFTIKNVADFYERVKLGDRIEFKRRFYSHFGIYVGKKTFDGIEKHYMMHVTTTEDTVGIMNIVCRSSLYPRLNQAKGRPALENLDGFVKTSTEFRINNLKDIEYTPFSPEVIVKRAYDAQRWWEFYDAVNNNCEHYVNYCRYGLKHSDQKDAAMGNVKKTGITSVATGGAGAVAIGVLVGMIGGPIGACAGAAIGATAFATAGAGICGVCFGVKNTLLAVERRKMWKKID